MTRRRSSTAYASLLLAVVLASPLAAANQRGQREPTGGRSSGKAEVRVAQPAPPSPTPRSQPTRQAVPRGDAGPNQRQPTPEARRTPRPDGGDHRSWGHYPFYRGPYSWYPWGWWGWWGWGSGPWYYPGYPWGGGVYWYPEQLRPSMGALDLDIRPEKAQVWLDGNLIGVADNFDGWPRHLWLEQGTYDLVFYHPDFETIARQYTIYPGVVIDVEDRMQRGEAVPPQELISRSTARRDERLQRREDRGETGDEPLDWRDRVRAERGAVAEEGTLDTREEPARLRLRIVPADAAVYLDGRFLGAAGELVEVPAGLIVEPGEHELEVVRPGYTSETTTFTAEPGEEVDLAVELEASG